MKTFITPTGRLTAVLLISSALCGCATVRAHVPYFSKPTITSTEAMRIYDQLEDLIAAGKDTPADRKAAFERIRAVGEDTAPYTFARAAITGRYVQEERLTAAFLVADVEHYARRSVKLDRKFRDGAATRLLGTLYVLAPTTLLKHGDSERGLKMLIDLAEKRPDVIQNHLCVAEAYLALGDPDPAVPHLCECIRRRADLRGDEQRLLDQLLIDADGFTCPDGAPAPAIPAAQSDSGATTPGKQ
jgi:hypothetical protein